MSLRTRAREIVVQLLYQDDMNKGRSRDGDMAFIRNRLHNNGNITQFAKDLLDGVRAKSGEIDAALAKVAENWKITRMAPTDRNTLRLGAYEILFHDTPNAVAVNEAIEIAKRYGNQQSFQFINGILDRLMKRSEEPDLTAGALPVSSLPQNAPYDPNEPKKTSEVLKPLTATSSESNSPAQSGASAKQILRARSSKNQAVAAESENAETDSDADENESVAIQNPAESVDASPQPAESELPESESNRDDSVEASLKNDDSQ